MIHSTAIVDEGAIIGEGTKIWHFCHVSAGAQIGNNCVLGQNVYVGPDVAIGNNVKIQNNVSVYSGVFIYDDVFLGPSCVFTNVKNPRAHAVGMFEPTIVERGVTVGANATIVCGVRLGEYSFIGAGAVVTKDVEPHALMAGNPARKIGVVDFSGRRIS